MSPEPAVIALPPVLDLKAARPLAGELLAARGGPVSLDASKVERLGALCLQVLLSARLTWAADDKSLILKDASPAFEEQFQRLGADACAFERGVPS
jgi:chemotaxis protein CheX